MDSEHPHFVELDSLVKEAESFKAEVKLKGQLGSLQVEKSSQTSWSVDGFFFAQTMAGAKDIAKVAAEQSAAKARELPRQP